MNSTIITRSLFSFLSIGICLLLTQCNTTELELIDNPSALKLEDGDPELVLNKVQLAFVATLNGNIGGESGINDFTSEIMRMEHLFGPYLSSTTLSPASINNLWKDAYISTLNNASLIIDKIATDENPLYGHVGISKLIQAYTFTILVDTFADVPFSEALDGNDNLNMQLEDGAIIYPQIITLIDSAINDLEKASEPVNDFFYNGDYASWIRLANTLKIKLHLQTRLVDADASKNGINEIIKDGNFINDISHSLAFEYSSSSTIDSRHPAYVNSYDINVDGSLIDTYYFESLKNDPRRNYYFYNPNNSTIITRNHGDNTPLSQFNFLTFGVYPAGGGFDDGSMLLLDNKSLIQGKGRGIFPIMMSSYVHFLLAEAALTLNIDGVDALSSLETAVRQSLITVRDTSDEIIAIPPELSMTDDEINSYVDDVIASYNTSNEQLDIIITEYYKALWGNGIEAWNNYRRTGFPSTIPASVNAAAGPEPLSFLYPADVVNQNNNINQKSITQAVFWDRSINVK